MKLVVGLGNPGGEYEKTRHNLGFRAIDELSRRLSIHLENFQDAVLWGRSSNVCLIKPLLFMNRSGEAIDRLISFYKWNSWDLVVINDDLDIPNGKLRIQKNGGSAGHKGVQSILERKAGWAVGDDWRVRLGVGHPESVDIDPASYVLMKIRPDEELIYDRLVNSAVNAILCGLDLGWDASMNQFNVS